MRHGLWKKITYLLALICACSTFLGAGLLSVTAEITSDELLLDLDRIVTVGPGSGDNAAPSDGTQSPKPEVPSKVTIRVYQKNMFLNNMRYEDVTKLEEALKEKNRNGMPVVLNDDYAEFHTFRSVKKMLDEGGYKVEETRNTK